MGGVGGCLGRHLQEKRRKVSRLVSLDAIDLQQGSLMEHLSAKESNQGFVAKTDVNLKNFRLPDNATALVCHTQVDNK